MKKLYPLCLILGVSLLFLSTASSQTNSTSSASPSAAKTKKSASGTHGGLNVCQGTFALCTEATCDPVGSGGNITGFKCKCKVDVGYSVGVNGPKNRNSCQSIPQAPPSVKQKIPSRYAPIKSFVACTNKRPWAMCLDAPCVVDHVDQNDPTKGTAVCACPKATGSPYGYIPADGQYSRSGCQDKYVSSATVADIIQVTQFLTTPAGKDLPPLPITILVPETTPAPTH